MATIHCNLLTGDDGNDANSSANPCRNVFRAIWQAAATDTILVSGTTIADPFRVRLDCPANATIKPATPGERFHASTCLDVTQGNIYEDTILRTQFSDAANGGRAWDLAGSASLDTTTANLWGGTGAGNGSVTMTAGQWLRKNYFMFNRKIRFRFGYKTDGAGVLGGRLEQDFPAQYGFSSGRYNWDFTSNLWRVHAVSEGFRDADGNEMTSSTWTEAVTGWITVPSSAADYESDTSGSSGNRLVMEGIGGQVWVQYLIVEVEAIWNETATDIWTLPYKGDSDYTVDAAVLGRVSTIAAIGDDLSGLFYATDASDYTTYRISEGGSAAGTGRSTPLEDYESYRDDQTNEVLRIKMPAGVDVNTIKLYMAHGRHGLHMTGTTSGGVIENCDMICNQVGVRVESTATWHAYNCNEYVSSRQGWEVVDEATLETYQHAGSYQPIISPSEKFYGGGFLSGEDTQATIPTLNVRGGECINAGDDAYQPIGAGILNIYGGTTIDAAGHDIEINGTNGPVMEIKGFSGDGFFVDQSSSASTVDMDNCSFLWINYVNTSASTYTIGAAVYTTADNIGGSGVGHATPWGVLDGAVNKSATLGYTSDTDLTPTTSSDLFEAGNKWWGTDPRPVGGNGEPFPDFKLDAGGNQSTHSVFHPLNLKKK